MDAAEAPDASPPVIRVAAIDVLRGVAILLVIGHHVVLDSHHVGRLRPLVGLLQRFGWTGVDLFFVLSGFLVGGLLLEELRTTERVRAARFLVRRVFKIWPAYYVFLLAVFLTAPAGDAARHLGANLVHLQNYLGTPQIHTWSLAVEEHFYLALAVGVALLARSRRGVAALPALVALSMAIGTTARWFAVHGAPYDSWRQVYPTHLRADGLLFGVLLAFGRIYRPSFREWVVRWRKPLLALGVALVSPMTVLPLDTSGFVRVWGFLLLYVGYGAIVVAASELRSADGWTAALFRGGLSRPLAFVGYHSYSIYLWHLFAGRTPAAALANTAPVAKLPPELQWLVLSVVYVTLAVVAGVVVGKLVERPGLALRDRLFPSAIARRDAVR